ncbi:CHASE2 domain-containing protein [Candidatus Uhrbacteria bacterium]|nr:CHASE2 domain-containing protein [Candidatus Uhrbacteria bacterium]MBD3284285.1 CHASE2 domain-containing protein [Candidatus Uhrbacteria bacterium]
MRKSSSNQKIEAPWRPMVISAGIVLFGIFASLSGALESWSHKASDRFFLDREPHPSILIVAIDDASIGSVGRWPWDRSVHGEIVRKLSNAGARVIGYDVNFPERQDASNDHALASAILDAGNVVLPQELQLIRTAGELSYNPDRVLRPIEPITDAAVRIGHSNTPPDPDGIVRRLPVRVEHTIEGISEAFGYEVAKLADPSLLLSDAPLDSLGQLIVHYPGRPERVYETMTAQELLEDRISPERIRDRVVLVGSTAPNLHDEQLTPTSIGTPMPGVEVHAALVHTLLARDWLMESPLWFTALLLIIIGLGLGYIVSHFRARWSTLALIVLWMGVLLLAFLAFDLGYIVDVVWPTFVLIFIYAVVSLERRITSEQERRKIKALFSRYVSPSVVETILEDPTKLHLGGERRRMTVFFSDIRGFTSISESMEPEELVTHLNSYLDQMTDIVFKHDGVLDKYIGDAVMAFWNAPFDQEDHALRAVKTALDMNRALDQMNEDRAFGDHEFRIGMGMNTGDMIVGNTGGKVHTDYTVLGDHVNLASRLESLTKEYGVRILVSQATVDELRGEVLVRKLDKVSVKGKREPVTIYEVVALKDRASVAQKEAVVAYEDALNDYFGRRFADASRKCQEMLKVTPENKSVQKLCERSQAFLDHPPTDDWDGRWVFTKK